MILLRRALAMRRFWYKFPASRGRLLATFQAYRDQGYVGTDCTELGSLRPPPPPGAVGRKAWRPSFRALGPMGLFLVSVHRAAAACECREGRLFVRSARRDDIDLFLDPWQCIGPWICDLAVQARCAYAAERRSDLHGGNEIDVDITLHRQRQAKEPAPTLGLERTVLTGQLLTPAWLSKIGLCEGALCPWCGRPFTEPAHLWFDCTEFQDVREGWAGPSWRHRSVLAKMSREGQVGVALEYILQHP